MDTAAIGRTLDELITTHLENGSVRFVVPTTSMLPLLRPGDRVVVRRTAPGAVRVGDVIVVGRGSGWIVHRVIARSEKDGAFQFVTKGDNCTSPDPPFDATELIGVVTGVERGFDGTSMESRRAAWINRAAGYLSRLHARAPLGVRKMARLTLHALVRFIAVILFFATFTAAHAAVTISDFSARAQGNKIHVTWNTATELNNAGFNLLRSTSSGGGFSKIAGLIPSECIGCIAGAPYAFDDGSVSAGPTYYYKLQSVDTGGRTQEFGPVSAAIAAPATATPTATRAPSSTPTTVRSSTPTPVRSSTPLPTSTRTLTPVSTFTATAKATSKAPTRIAAVIASPTPPPIAPTVTPDPPPTEIALAANAPVLDEEFEPDPSDYAPAGTDRLTTVRRMIGWSTIMVTFGLGSFIFGFLAFVLLMRATRPR